ncbi:MAG: rhodanese-related sulfurtransferase [Candidatus Magasanikbacteria bacterium]|nr:rhodanese-related sulfurtransferase [Candidatus Magasanikbacteria bacterium]
MYQILLYYKYIPIENPEELMREQRALCEKLRLKGRIIIAKEGINGTVEGTIEDTETYIEEMKKDSRFADIHWKKSDGIGNAFPKLRVRVRDEIVSTHLEEKDVDPRVTTGKYLTPEELHSWIHPSAGSGQAAKEFYIIDMRNDFEYAVGHFENSFFPNLQYFRNLPGQIEKLSHLKNKTILTVCTGGVRCEKASGFLLTQGFDDVYQLKGGIVSYMERYPNLDFKGKLYVFDKRLVMGFNTESSDHEIIGRCVKCESQCERMINCINDECSRHFILCADCADPVTGRLLCPMGCRPPSVRHRI